MVMNNNEYQNKNLDTTRRASLFGETAHNSTTLGLTADDKTELSKTIAIEVSSRKS